MLGVWPFLKSFEKIIPNKSKICKVFFSFFFYFTGEKLCGFPDLFVVCNMFYIEIIAENFVASPTIPTYFAYYKLV